MDESRYIFDDHISSWDQGQVPGSTAEQREVTVQSYRTSKPFDPDEMRKLLKRARLEPLSQVGLIHFLSGQDEPDLRVVLAYQGEARIRTYDYDEARLRWWTWNGVVLETMALRYWGDSEGLLRFTTFGGGRRLSRDRIAEFHSRVINLVSNAVSPVAINPTLLTLRCREDRFFENLFALQFTSDDPEYESIDHTAFRSKKHMKSDAKRLHHFQQDTTSVVEAFESDLKVKTRDVSGELLIRFLVRSSTGSIRLRIPDRIPYLRQFDSIAAQAQAFYGIIERAVESIVGDGLFDDLPVDPALMGDQDRLLAPCVKLDKYVDYLRHEANRREFFDHLDTLGESFRWLPHVRALDGMFGDVNGGLDIGEVLVRLVAMDPGEALRLFERCREHGLQRLRQAVGEALLGSLPSRIAPPFIPCTEEAVLMWACNQEECAFEPDPVRASFLLEGVRFHHELVEPSLRVRILMRMAGTLHQRLVKAPMQAAGDLAALAWVTDCLADLADKLDQVPPAVRVAQRLRLAAAERSTTSAPVDWQPGEEQQAFDDAGLPIWPRLACREENGQDALFNLGWVPVRVVIREGEAERTVDIQPGSEVGCPSGGGESVEVAFEAFGQRRVVVVGVERAPASGEQKRPPRPRPLFSRQDRVALRRKMDPKGEYIGQSDAVLEIFEQIHLSNLEEPHFHVIITGEPGTGKTHLARLIHSHSRRAQSPFVEDRGAASSSGGDERIIQGEYCGFAREHGVSGIPPEGRKGRFQEADKGTLFIDDFESLPRRVQDDLLAVMEGRKVNQVGGAAFRADVRLILATNHDLGALVATGRIRQDFLDRANQTRLHLPPLRERRPDLDLLVEYFVKDYCVELDHRSRLALLEYDWPANVRQLRDAVALARRAKNASGDSVISLRHLTMLPAPLVERVQSWSDEECERRALYLMGQRLVAQGLSPDGTGFYAELGKLIGLSRSQASRKYRKIVLGEDVR